MDKVVDSADEAVRVVGDGAFPAVGDFGLCGIPGVLIAALLGRHARELDVARSTSAAKSRSS